VERIVEDIFNNRKYYKTKDYIEQKSKKRISDKRFKKCFDDLLIVYSLLTGSEPKVLSFILLNINNQNCLKITYKNLSKKTNISIIRIKQIMKKLQNLNVVKNIGGIIYVNPFMFVKKGEKEEELQLEYMPIFKGEHNEKQNNR